MCGSRNVVPIVYGLPGPGHDRIYLGPGDDGQGSRSSGGSEAQGGGAPDVLHGGPGNDEMFGDGKKLNDYNPIYNDRKGGPDKLYGDAGNDSLDGDAGADTLYGGPGKDQLLDAEWAFSAIYEDLAARDVLHGGSGDDVLVKYAAGDQGILPTLPGDAFYGEEGNDRIYTSAQDPYNQGGPDVVWGGPGDDVIYANDRWSRTVPEKVVPDEVRCGAGVDKVIADEVDRVADDCEKVTRK
jgi:Ca2+-binding RTX toxin-like protein